MSQPLTLRTESGDELVDLPEFEARVRRGEVSPQCLVRFAPVTGERFQPACELELFQRLHEPRRAHFARAFKLGRFPWVTTGVIGVNLLAYAFTAQQGPLDVDAMVRFGGKVGPLITDLGEVWRLLTANFLHRDALHIGLNLFVLFNVGGALENAYRVVDYVTLLVVSGLATMTASLFLSDAVSLGASGMVYGCLGGVVVFGIKYRAILPPRYRTVMGEAAIPSVVGLLLIGLTSPGVDNWAHLGGLAAGLVCATLMRPKLLDDSPAHGWARVQRALPAGVLLAAATFGQSWLADSLPVLRVQRDDAYGLSVPLPEGWRRGANRLGQLAYYNGLPGLGRATFAAEAVESQGPVDVQELAGRFIDETLRPSALGPEVLKVTAEAPEPARVGGHDALRVHARLQETFGVTLLEAYFVPRGEWVYQLVFSHPAAFPRYSQVVDQVLAGIRFEEPKALRQARARALLFPHSPSSLALLGEALRRHGEPFAAAEALRQAVVAVPSDGEARTELAYALLQAGELEEGCLAADAARLYAPQSVAAREAQARCELQQGNLEAALLHVQEAREVAPTDERLKRAERKLRAALGASER